MLSDSARTANEAAVAVGCEVGQIVKSLVFVRDETPVMVLCAGDRRVDAKRLGLIPASAEQAHTTTGFAIGGIPPLGACCQARLQPPRFGRMSPEELRNHCHSFAGTEETFPFGPETSVFKVGGKIFALSRLTESPLRVSRACLVGLTIIDDAD